MTKDYKNWWIFKKIKKQKKEIPPLYPKLLSEKEYMEVVYKNSIGVREKDMFLYPGEYEYYLMEYREYKINELLK